MWAESQNLFNSAPAKGNKECGCERERGKEQTLRKNTGDRAYMIMEEIRKIEIENNGDGMADV